MQTKDQENPILSGLIHEHARPDRGSYITINTNNIQPDRLYNFEMESDPGYLSADNYDYMR